MSTLPKKEDGEGKWFIRAHHLECLTAQPKSIKDDVLNSRYYSHINSQYGIKEQVQDDQQSIEDIEKHI